MLHGWAALLCLNRENFMNSMRIMTGAALAGLLALAGCGEAREGDPPATEESRDAAGASTISEGLGDATKFAAAAESSGLEATLDGPGPYTVLVPTDPAFDKLPAGALDTLMKEEARQELTGVLTYHILPGAMLAADIGKAIDAGKGKAVLATMAGGTLTATRDGDAIVIADGAGTKARIVGSDEKRSNGVIHRVDAVLMPS
ncbi:MAG TPA: fasciclin domain-containing protein [Sphingomicrobium sp.]|nr:fasciclin domain-containing protein [Sphingomicrobium sp.]